MEKRICTTYSIVTPESAEEGDFAESGWENEGGEVIELDELDAEGGMTISDTAAQWLWDNGACWTSCSAWSPGLWYIASPTPDYATGEEKELCFHLKGFTTKEEIAIYGVLKRNKVIG